MTGKLPALLFAAAAAIAFIGGRMQHAGGPGSEPGLTVSHTAAVVVVAALLATVVWRIDRFRRKRKAVITATVVAVGPYASAGDARSDLVRVQQQFDEQGRYRWGVENAAPGVIGVANHEAGRGG